jgi:hypothetical protein
VAAAGLVPPAALNITVPPPNDAERTLDRIEADLKHLEAEYNMFFAGRSPRPPWETRNRVQALFRQYDRAPFQNYGARFRLATLQSRFASLVELWDRGLRAREEGRGGVPASQALAKPREKPVDRVVRVESRRDPAAEPDKLRALYESLSEAHKAVGGENVPFERFSELVADQVQRLRRSSDGGVAFRVAVHDGKVSFTAKALKGEDGGGSGTAAGESGTKTKD